MIKIISVAFVLVLASASAQAMPLAPIQQPDSMITSRGRMRSGQGTSHGVCVARTTKRHARRCARWNGSTAHAITDRQSNNGP